MHDLQRLFSVICVSIAASVVTTWALEAPPPLVSFNVKSTIDQYHKTLLASSLPVSEQTERLADFATVMNEEVAQYAKEHGQVVLVSAAVVDGTPDITAHIQQAIVERYQK
ncbi:type-F conjugative transfer system protein TrbI [Vibrio sp. THAF190c]|uniref:type-F conjugative transfer system protein TrbI n=1 Tax=Vibrio sp. THAF190c TaxID=2587865 RepID=UPI0012A7E940|nr:type-F conjugative transfer system protein TrbI [Vibrio sp. THAF190c]QFT13611.1 Type-F conjugative transfer system protein [Vibrio sp. THAF190c]